jgi:hypothetical protein
MLNIFKKKFKDMPSYSDRWSMLQGIDEGKIIFIRARNIQDAVGHPEYPFQIGVAIPLKQPTGAGLPNPQESEALRLIEDKLIPALTKDDETVFVMALTTHGMREFVFYAKEWKPEFFEEKVNEVEKSSAPYELQYMMKHDPNWESYATYTSTRFSVV